MNATELTFGVEIETQIPCGAVPVGAYHVGATLSTIPGLGGWKAMRDGSIRCGRGFEPCEFVSPVLRGAEGIHRVLAALEAIKALGGRVNASCGFHVHVGWTADAKAMARLITLTANHEKGIYATTGTKNRERSGWCRSVQATGSVRNANINRYQILNLTNLSSGRQQTVEFRAFGGTLNAGKIIAYIRLCLGIVERAQKAKRVTKWVAKTPVETSPIHRSGEGQTELTRLFYQLGWTKGRTDYTYGEVVANGVPSIQANKRALMKLARKYDGQ